MAPKIEIETRYIPAHLLNFFEPTNKVRPKDLVGIPWMLAFALRANGFYLRQDIIYSKGNPMPESVKDRFTKSHEYIFLLTKSKNYYFDADAVKEDAVCGGKKVKLGAKSFSKGQANAIGIEPSGNAAKPEFEVGLKRNKRSVWHMNSKPFKDAHFATFSEELVITPILAGTSEHGCCAMCGAPYRRNIEHISGTSKECPRTEIAHLMRGGTNFTSQSGTAGKSGGSRVDGYQVTRGWVRSCECVCDSVIPCTVLDIFSGAATTGKVALSRGRNYIGLEQNSFYNEIARKRLLNAGLDVEVLC